jgi:hypothetical protein
MKNTTCKRFNRLHKIDEYTHYHIRNVLTDCLERIKNLYPLNDETKNIIYNMSAEDKMLIILEYDNNLQSILKNIIN